MRSRIPLLGAAVLAAAGACSPAASPTPAQSPTQAPTATPAPAAIAAAPAVPLPRVALVTLGGEPANLEDVARGRVAVVSLWATWCEACSKEFDALNRLSAAAASHDDALVVAVAVGERRATVDAFVRNHRLRYAQLVDEDFRLADALGQRNVPATLVLDRAGRIVYRGEALDRNALGAFRRALDARE